MALRFIETFDFCASVMADRWDSENTNIDSANGRGGGRCLALNTTTYAYKNFDSQTTWIVGAAIKTNYSISNTLYPTICLHDVASKQLSLHLWGDRSIRIYRDTTLLETATATWNPTTYHYFEFKATIDNAVGAYEVRMDGNTIMSDTNVDTQTSGNASADRIKFGGVMGFMDDIYFCDGTGGAFDDFLGNVHIGSSITDGSGNHSAWTPNTGNDYEAVDDAPTFSDNHDGDTTYVYTDGAADRSSFTYDNAAADLTTLRAVQLTIAYRKDDVGARSITPFIRIDATDQDSAALTCADGYQIDTIQYEKQPDATDWNETDFNAMEVGVKEGA